MPMALAVGNLNELLSALLVPFTGDAGSAAEGTTPVAPAEDIHDKQKMICNEKAVR